MSRKVIKLALQSEEYNTKMTPDYDYGIQTSYTLQLFYIIFLLCSCYVNDMIKKLELFNGSYNFI